MTDAANTRTTRTLPITFSRTYNQLEITVQNDTSTVYVAQGYCNTNSVNIISNSKVTVNWIAMGL